ncbi:hypothetical protein [Mediterranea massiliensis]|uniref:hypothetical protein n=1 Tax=Mediterranea massiliensis TaxID=1841865 RepID=UPI0025A3213B|nr:hypothetical protein [Mediterranea massiliensis]MDM8338278.1 hypothetical protein [Mediterranea massiliensis]
MRRLLFAFLAGFFSILTIFAQEVSDKNAMVLRIGKMEFQDPALKSKIKPDFEAAIVQMLENALRAAAGESQRFEITDSLTAAKLDDEMRSEVAAMVDDPQRATDIRKKAFEAIFAVDWVLDGAITQVQMMKKGNYGYICTAHITVTVKDRRSDVLRVVDTRPFVNVVKETKIRPKATAAFQAALDELYPRLVAYFSNNFPVYGKLLRLNENNDAVVNCGLKYNLQKGDVFQVTHMIPQKNADEKFYYEENIIGTLKVKEVLDEACICNITSGEDKILSVNEQGGFMQCKQIMK